MTRRFCAAVAALALTAIFGHAASEGIEAPPPLLKKGATFTAIEVRQARILRKYSRPLERWRAGGEGGGRAGAQHEKRGLARPWSAPSRQILTRPRSSPSQNCTPLNLLIAPGPAYALEASPPGIVVPTLTPSGVLRLGVRAFNASAPVLLRATLPAEALARVTASGGGAVTVAPGFNASALALVNAGPATLFLSGYANPDAAVAVSNLGPGTVVIDSLIRTTAVEGGGSGGLTVVRGVTRSVAVDMGGLSRLIVDPASADVSITGMTGGMAAVQATRGRCGVVSQNGGFFGPPCAPVAGVTLPPAVTAWSCGLAVKVDGVLGCDPAAGRGAVVLGGGGGGFTTTMAGGGGGGTNFVSVGGGSGMTMTSGGGSGATFISSSSSTGGPGGGGGGTIFSSNGGGGGGFYTINSDGTVTQAPVVRAPACTASAKELVMTLE